jgi:hypothetical protein
MTGRGAAHLRGDDAKTSSQSQSVCIGEHLHHAPFTFTQSRFCKTIGSSLLRKYLKLIGYLFRGIMLSNKNVPL